MDESLDTLDLSGHKLKKLNKAQPNETEITTLILDENELQKLDNIDSYSKIQKLSLVRNQLIRMYGVCRLHNLTTLNLANNGIVTIEGLKDLVSLKYLCLAGNSIKVIEHLNSNTNLEHLDLSENNITHISDISYLRNLKELLLHGNRIGHLRNCERYLPPSLVTLTLASNSINDLNEISQLVHLINLNNFSITNNPCVLMSGNKVGFDYRPFIINWCMSLKIIDGYVVDAIESLRAEWLYSQGRGRHFRVGDHQELIQYLASVCPLSGETLQTEEDRKLRLILSKAQHHQQQLREQLTANGSLQCSPTPSPGVKRRMNPRNSPRQINSTRISRLKSPDRMTSSCIMPENMSQSISENISSPLMTQSLDPNMLNETIANKTLGYNSIGDLNNVFGDGQVLNSPLQAATKLVPVPESLMSPDYRPSNTITNRPAATRTIIPTSTSNRSTMNTKKEPLRGSPKLNRTPHSSPRQQRSAIAKGITSSPLRQQKNTIDYQNINKTSVVANGTDLGLGTNTSTPQTNNSASTNSMVHSSDEDSEMCDSKLQTIRNLALVRCKREPEQCTVDNKRIENAAATFIQKMWRGYYTRNLDKVTIEKLKTIKDKRTREYIEKLTNDMETTKAALESERKIQMLQMQAINALWKKVSTMQPGEKGDGRNNTDTANVNITLSSNEIMTLTQTCTVLSSQVQELQGSVQEMRELMKNLSLFCSVSGDNQSHDSGIATQTEISAVHTPQGDAGKLFPFQRTQQRPSSLALPVVQRRRLSDPQHMQSDQSTSDAPEEVQQFVGSLVNDAIKIVAENNTDTDSTETITILNDNTNDSENAKHGSSSETIE